MTNKVMRGWKKQEFNTPDNVWNLKLEGVYREKRKDQMKESKLSGTSVKLVYIYLLRCLDVFGEVFPSYRKIGEATEMSSKQVERCVNFLCEIKLIEKRKRYKKDSKERDSNLYVIYHPDQIPTIPRIDAASEGYGRDVHGGTDAASEGYGRDVHGGTDAASEGMDGESKNSFSSSSSIFSSSSVIESDKNYVKVNEAWQESFKELLDPAIYLTLTKYAEIDFIVDILKKIKKHHDISAIHDNFAFVYSCIDKGGYIVPTKPKPKKKSINKKFQGRGEIVPKSLQSLEIKEDTDEQSQPKENVSHEEKQRRIKEKLNRMNEEFNKNKEKRSNSL
ncbi:hypothetical protein [Hazenella coriacea]|uniref:Helix-turn-helix protein n=1 Tax=Hazenella coriacea TaxID=1179467 RepID=A0A4R3L5A0_9BACL|nr:hypothetical protein [Hazenella coriacea]TCS92215.1 hypothetical protein EDD58_1146 [Hazenella coriacea]